MEKEAQIYKLSVEILRTPCLQSKQGEAYQLAKLLYAQGYRKLPKDKPPLLSDERLWQIVEELYTPMIIAQAVAEAQGEADIKFYSEGRNETENQ